MLRGVCTNHCRMYEAVGTDKFEEHLNWFTLRSSKQFGWRNMVFILYDLGIVTDLGGCEILVSVVRY